MEVLKDGEIDIERCSKRVANLFLMVRFLQGDSMTICMYVVVCFHCI